MNLPPKILIADDHQLFNEGIKIMLSTEEFEVIGQVYKGNEIIPFILQNRPDIILLDMNMPNMTGMEVSKIIKKDFPELKIIIVTTYNEHRFVEEFQKIGVAGYLLKNSSKDELLQAIQAVLAGKQFFDPKLFLKNTPNLHSDDDFVKRFNLTNRELEIIRFLKDGFTNHVIAEKLFLSVFTVDTHRKNINLKLNIKNPAELIKFAVEHGL
jgi:DNA-binding NarL/FixJ family response regulator